MKFKPQNRNFPKLWTLSADSHQRRNILKLTAIASVYPVSSNLTTIYDTTVGEKL